MRTELFRNFINQDSELWRVLKRLPRPEPDGPWLAGGSVWKAIENCPIAHDIDFFFRDAEQLEQHKRVMNSIPYCYHVVGETKNKYNTTYQFHISEGGYNKTIAVQFVSFRFWSRIEELLDGFDFTACQFGFDGERLVIGDTALEDVRSRVIRFNNVRDSVATAIHLKKYLDKGFSILVNELPKFNEIMASLNKSPTPKKISEMQVLSSDDDDEGYPRPVNVSHVSVSPAPSFIEIDWAPPITLAATQYATQTINPQFYGTINIGGIIPPGPTTMQDLVNIQPMTENTPTIPMTVRLPHPTNPNLEIIGEL